MPIILAGMVTAETPNWDNLYLANLGGTRLLQVDPSDADTVTAYVDGTNGFRMSVTCSTDSSSLSIAQIGNGIPFMGSDVQLFGVFDGEPEIRIGQAQYSRGSYRISLQPSILARILTRNEVLLSANETGFFDTFSLRNSVIAIEKMRCFGGKP
ncbi:hypothetical protein L0666_11145 [Octadecabacter sp. CECT 8868]|uniref:hypothetical protein n=1 Tax=Octadecabacter algicola TaxID=2909342 RepID=UPI001F47EEFC|nr:hypothetical protein [Octadecabacter algicola]MCF2905543.1 hypothetical protein [Octadecabacter algicola]